MGEVPRQWFPAKSEMDAKAYQSCPYFTMGKGENQRCFYESRQEAFLGAKTGVKGGKAHKETAAVNAAAVSLKKREKREKRECVS